MRDPVRTKAYYRYYMAQRRLNEAIAANMPERQIDRKRRTVERALTHYKDAIKQSELKA